VALLLLLVEHAHINPAIDIVTRAITAFFKFIFSSSNKNVTFKTLAGEKEIVKIVAKLKILINKPFKNWLGTKEPRVIN
jgi:hypothetical protein